jgi:hypothetical protein
MNGTINADNLTLYGQSWSETNPAERLKLYEQCLSPECVYTDPNVKVTGYEALSAYMAKLQGDVPGVAFVPTDLKLHHGCCLMHWNMVDGGGAVISPGVSYLQFGADGRLIQMNGFFDLNASEVKE